MRWLWVTVLFLGAPVDADERALIPTLTQQDIDNCRSEGGCLVISRDALRATIAVRERMALQACRNLL